jgi:hypothetical protein
VVVNRPGAAGAVAVGELTRAAPDGYTFILTPHSALVIAPQINDLPYKTPDDYDPFINLVAYYPLIAVRTESKYKTIRELLSEAKDNPGLIRVGTPGEGTSSHLNLEELMHHAGRQDGARAVRRLGAVERLGARRPHRGGGRAARRAQAHGRGQAHARPGEFHAAATCRVPRRPDGPGARLGCLERRLVLVDGAQGDAGRGGALPARRGEGRRSRSPGSSTP